MQFDNNNPVVRFCIKGMEQEAKDPAEARALFAAAWNIATTDEEKFTAAHYLARQQSSINEKLEWDEIALAYALKMRDESVLQSYPSLYLNVAKGYEDQLDFDKAVKHYQLALSFAQHLPDNGYGHMIRSGIQNGLSRMDR